MKMEIRSWVSSKYIPITLVFCMAFMVVIFGGCTPAGSGASSADTSEIDSAAFNGEMILSADEALSKMGNDGVILVDCTGDIVGGTPKGAIALTWQDLATCSAEYGQPSDEAWGKIPEASKLADILGSYGLDKNKEIICLGHTTSGWGDDGRVAWTLRAAGFKDVKLVDGGKDALLAAGAETQMSARNPTPCEVQIDEVDKTHVMETDELLANFDSYKIVDTRALEEYEGATLYGEKKGGHIPGAIHIPYLDLFKSDGTLKSNDEITALFEDAGIAKTDKVVTYCTGGIRSAYVQMVLEMCGFEHTMNYDQSFWRWCVVGEVES